MFLVHSLLRNSECIKVYAEKYYFENKFGLNISYSVLMTVPANEFLRAPPNTPTGKKSLKETEIVSLPEQLYKLLSSSTENPHRRSVKREGARCPPLTKDC